MVKIPTGIVKNLPDFRKFSKFIFSNQKKITPNFFATELRSIKNDYMLANERQLFCQRADRLAEQLEVLFIACLQKLQNHSLKN